MKCFIAGGAGFIGSNLTRRLLAKGWSVTVYDNLSGGKKEFLAPFSGCRDFHFVCGDLLNKKLLSVSIKGCEAIFHLAASSNISLGNKRIDLDMRNGFLTTFNILEAMQKNNVRKIVFTSSGSIYGKGSGISFIEDSGPVFPLSLYAASKVASEAYISSFCNIYDMQAWIFRLANIVGPNATHGVIFDFIRKLKGNPRRLEILGNGKQRKPYLYLEECIDGMIYAFTHSRDKLNYFNLSCSDTADVNSIARIVLEAMCLENVRFTYTGKDTGWPGDQKEVRLNPAKINRLGWRAKMNSREAIRMATKKILAQGGA